jgi:hypothetical protein
VKIFEYSIEHFGKLFAGTPRLRKTEMGLPKM